MTSLLEISLLAMMTRILFHLVLCFLKVSIIQLTVSDTKIQATTTSVWPLESTQTIT